MFVIITKDYFWLRQELKKGHTQSVCHFGHSLIGKLNPNLSCSDLQPVSFL